MYWTSLGMLYRFTIMEYCKVNWQDIKFGILQGLMMRDPNGLQQREDPVKGMWRSMVGACFRNIVMWDYIPAAVARCNDSHVQF